MTPEERAEEALSLPVWPKDGGWDECVAVIAGAIRDAENDALERAARKLDTIRGESLMSDEPNRRLENAIELAAGRVRSLKSEPTP